MIDISSAEPLSETLKKATKVQHAEAESVLLRRIKAIATIHDYVGLLSLMHGYFLPVEELIAAHLNSNQLPQAEQCQRSPLLYEDAAALSLTLRTKTASLLPAINNEPQAWGASYVLEGSTLGGVHIAAMLQKKLQLPTEALTFFAGYGKETPAMWQAFRDAMNAAVQGDEQRAQAVMTANETFNCMRQWMETFDK